MALPDLKSLRMSEIYKGFLHTNNVSLEGNTLAQVYDGLGNSAPIKLKSFTDGGASFSGILSADNFSIKTFSTLIDYLYPIGAIYLSTNSANPSQRFSGTSWEQVSKGRFLVGVGTESQKTFDVGNNDGNYSINVDTDHYHGIGKFQSSGNDDGFFIISGKTSSTITTPVWNDTKITHTLRRIPGGDDSAVYNNSSSTILNEVGLGNTGYLPNQLTYPNTSMVTTGVMSYDTGTNLKPLSCDTVPYSYGVYIWERIK